jgi:penicillin-binding protein 1C
VTAPRKIALLLSVFLLVVGGTWYFLPRPPLLDDVTFSSTVRDRHGVLLRLATATDQRYRIRTAISEVPTDLVTAVMTQEDRTYWQHIGINPFSLVRAASKLIVGGPRSGASTLTMQVARLRYHLNTRTIPGKLRQILYALQIERHYRKEQILEAYFNLAPYGRNIEGIGAASLIYFDKKPGDLNRQEVLSLAVLPQSPAKRAPVHGIDPESLLRARERLNRLTWHDPLADLPLHYRRIEDLPFSAPHCTQAALGHQSCDLRLTLDLATQTIAQTELQQYLRDRSGAGINNAAALLIDSASMEILASVGSGGFWSRAIAGQNDGTRQFRSPGSTLKPFVYGMAVEHGLINPSSLLFDAPARFGNYVPENIDGSYEGPVPARLALVRSRNLPAVTLAARLGPDALYRFLKTAEVRGLKSNNPYGLSAVLGTVDITMEDLVKLYAALVNSGRLKPLRKALNDPKAEGVAILSPEASFITLDMLTTSEAAIHLPTAPSINLPYKTGTSTGFHDAWCCGIIGRYVLAVWIGNFDGRANPSFTGRSAAVPLFIRIASKLAASQKINVTSLTPPAEANLLRIDVCSVSGCIAGPHCPHTKKEWVIPGVSPITRCHLHSAEGLENWDSEAGRFFESAGLPRKAMATTDLDFDLRLLPLPKVVSWQRTQAQSERVLALRARTGNHVKHLCWFANRTFLGVADCGKPFYWSPAPGMYTIAATDDQGHTDSTQIRVILALGSNE